MSKKKHTTDDKEILEKKEEFHKKIEEYNKQYHQQ